MRAIRVIRAITPFLLLAGSLAAAPAASAHTHIHVGEYELSIGWGNEPTYVGVPNFIEVSITDADGEPVTDLAPGDITVVVSTSDQSTEALPLEPQFVVDVYGTPGQYGADLLPTVPGEYRFQFAGTLRDETVDVTVTSGEDTFSPVNASTDVEFPVKVPTLAEVQTSLDRINGRIEDAQAAADRASTMGLLVGGAGLVVAFVALVVAWQATRKGARSA